MVHDTISEVPVFIIFFFQISIQFCPLKLILSYKSRQDAFHLAISFLRFCLFVFAGFWFCCCCCCLFVYCCCLLFLLLFCCLGNHGNCIHLGICCSACVLLSVGTCWTYTLNHAPFLKFWLILHVAQPVPLYTLYAGYFSKFFVVCIFSNLTFFKYLSNTIK